MAQKTCPDCGREITGYGRFCNFCGWDLRKKKQETPRKDSGAAWNPDEVYARKKSTAAIVVMAAVIALVIAVAGVTVYGGLKDLLPEKLPVTLSADMSASEARKAMRNAGFRQISSSSSSLGDSWLYDSREVLGIQTVDSMLHVFSVSDTSHFLNLSHYFAEDGKGTIDKPGKIFGELLDKLSRICGTPEKDERSFHWEKEGITLKYYTDDTVVLSQFYSR